MGFIPRKKIALGGLALLQWWFSFIKKIALLWLALSKPI